MQSYSKNITVCNLCSHSALRHFLCIPLSATSKMFVANSSQKRIHRETRLAHDVESLTDMRRESWEESGALSGNSKRGKHHAERNRTAGESEPRTFSRWGDNAPTPPKSVVLNYQSIMTTSAQAGSHYISHPQGLRHPKSLEAAEWQNNLWAGGTCLLELTKCFNLR